MKIDLSKLADMLRTDPGSIGAIETGVPRHSAPHLMLHALFEDGGPRGGNPIDDAKRRLAELGLGDLLDFETVGGLTPGEVADRVAEAVGAPCDVRTFDPSSNEAFFLFAFAIAYHEACHDWRDPEWKALKQVALGRLLEWWRWRRQGLDQMAVAERAAVAHRRRGGATLRDRAEPKREMALELAERILAGRTSPPSKSELARLVMKAWGEGAPAFDTIRGYLKSKIAG